MSVEKTFKGVRLSDEELLVIQNIQEKYGLSNFSQTISYLIREYPHLQEENEKLRDLFGRTQIITSVYSSYRSRSSATSSSDSSSAEYSSSEYSSS